MADDFVRGGGALLRGVVLLVGALWAVPAHGQNPFETFLISVCGGPVSGALAVRCAESGGDLSSDSEDSLNPTQLSTSNAAALLRSRSTTAEIEDRLLEARSGEPKSDRPDFFASLRGLRFDRDANRRVRGIEGDIRGFQLGVDHHFGEQLVLGALAGYERSDSEFDSDDPGVAFTPLSDDGSIDSDSYLVALYGSFALGSGGWIEGNFGYGLTEYDVRRRAVFQESSRVIAQTNVLGAADPDGSEYMAGIGVGYDYRAGPLVIGGYVREDWVRSWIESHHERDELGSGLALSIDRQKRDSLTTTVGISGSYSLNQTWGVLTPQMRIEFVHDAEADAQESEVAFLLDPLRTPFDFEGQDPDQNYVHAAAGFALVLANGWMPYVDFEVLLGYDDLDRQTLVAGLRKEF